MKRPQPVADGVRRRTRIPVESIRLLTSAATARMKYPGSGRAAARPGRPAGRPYHIHGKFVFLQRNRPEDVGLPSIERYHGEPEAVVVADVSPTQEPDGSWKLVGQVLQNRMVWLLAAVYFLAKPTRYLILFGSPVYVNERLDPGTAESGLLGSMYDLAGPVGTLAGGYLSDSMFQSRRMPVGVIALVSLAILMMGFQYLPLTKAAIGAGLFAAGFLVFIPDSLLSGTAAIDFDTKRGASTASGIVNGCGSIGQIIGVTLPGWVGRFLAEGRDIWNSIFFGLGLALALAGLLLVPHWNRVPIESKSPAPK